MAENDNVKETGAGNTAPKAEEKVAPKVAPKAEEKVAPEKPSETRELVSMLTEALRGNASANAPARQGTPDDFPLSETVPGGKFLVNHKWQNAEGQPIKNLTAEEKDIADRSMKTYMSSLRRESGNETEPGEL